MADVFVWSCCEPFVGIICACLPTYGPLFARFSWFKGGSSKSADGPSGGNFSGGKDLITFGGSRMPMKSGNNSTAKSKGWSRVGKSQQQSSSFRTRPDEDEIELTATVLGGKNDGYGSHADESGRLGTQTSDSDGADEHKNMQVHVQTDMKWQVEYKK